MPSVPHVVWLFEYPTLLGGERSLLACLPAIRAAGWQVTAIAPPRGPLRHALADGDVPVLEQTWHEAGRRRPLEVLRGELTTILRRLRPDLLHANSLSMGRLSGPVAEELHLPSLSHLRDIIGLSAAAVSDLSRHRRLLAVSQATRDYHAQQGVPAERIEVLYNGVDLERFAPRPASGWLHTELNVPPETPLIGAIGQWVLRKGHDVLLAALELLLQDDPAWPGQLLLIGECPSRKDEALAHVARLRHMASQPPLSSHVHFLGPRDDVPQILPELTALAHPARQEPLGRVLLEAAACGTPVVATAVGGTMEIFGQDEPAALLFPADDVAACAAALRRVVDSAALRDDLSRRARQRAEACFDARQAAVKLVEQYHRVCEQVA